MASWLVDLPWQREGPYEFLEFYSGMARVSRLAQVLGYEARGFDISYDSPPSGTSPHSGRANRSAFDINGEAGFLLLGDPSAFINLWGDVYAIKTCSLVESQPLKKSYQTYHLLPRLAILMILEGDMGELVTLLGMVCSTWTIVNRATSMRDVLVPYGQACYLAIRKGNKMVSRTRDLLLYVGKHGKPQSY